MNNRPSFYMESIEQDLLPMPEDDIEKLSDPVDENNEKMSDPLLGTSTLEEKRETRKTREEKLEEKKRAAKCCRRTSVCVIAAVVGFLAGAAAAYAAMTHLSLSSMYGVPVVCNCSCNSSK